MKRKEITLLIIDQDSLFWEGFRHLLEKNPYIRVRKVTEDKSVFLPLLEDEEEKIVLISGHLLEIYKKDINKLFHLPHLKGIVIADRTENYLSDALEVGALGYAL